MGSQIAIIVTFIIYLAVLLLIGLWADRKYARTYRGFIAANKGLGA